MHTLPLHSIQAALGAQFADFDGWYKPTLYADCLTEYRAVREAAGLLDRSERGMVAIRGGDRCSWLQGMVSNDVRRLAEGARVIDACILDSTGHIRSDVRIVRRQDDLLLDLPRSEIEDIVRLLEGYVVMEDVEVIDQSDTLVVLSVQGPHATPEFVSACGCDSDVLAVPSDHTGSGGYDLYAPVDRAEDIWHRLMRAGAIPVGEDAAETLRIEAGIPKFGADMDNRTIPLEANLEATHVSLSKGCYVGQEVIARIVSRGHTNRALTGFTLEGPMLPQQGDRVLPMGEGSDRELGWVSSACQSIYCRSVIAMGYLRHESRAPGTQVTIMRAGTALSATVSELPFV